MDLPYEQTGAAGDLSAWKHLDNGLDVIVLPDSTAPVAALMVTYRVGSRNESAGLTGATHFLEHLMFKGSKAFNKAAGTSVFQTLQRVGAQVNATTWNDRTNYYEVLPANRLGLAAQVEADRMRNALLDDDDIASERTVILNELDRGENEPIRKLYQSVWSAAFVAHPYRHPTIGWRSDVETMAPQGLRGFYDAFYWPDNATVSIIGDTTVEAALELVHEHFGSIPSAPIPFPAVTTREPRQVGERSVTVRMAGELGASMLAFKSPVATDERTDALELLASVLVRGKSSRLYRKLVDPGTATSVSSSTTRFRDPGLFYVLTMLAPDTTHDQVEEAVRESIDEIAANGVTDQEITRALSQIRAHEAFLRDGPYSIAAQLNEAIAAGNWRLYADRLSRMEKVDSSAVQAAAEEFLVTDQLTRGRFEPV